MDLTALHEPVAFALACVIFSAQLVIAGFLGTWIVRVVDDLARRL